MMEYKEEELSPLPERPKRVEVEEEIPPMEKPYLKTSDLNGRPKKDVLILEWMESLFSKTNLEGVLEALSYYTEIGWISQEVRTRLMSYVKDFLEVNYPRPSPEVRMGDRKYRITSGENQEASTGSEGAKGAVGATTGRLSLDDHLRSLDYVLEISDRISEDEHEEAMKRAGVKRERAG